MIDFSKVLEEKKVDALAELRKSYAPSTQQLQEEKFVEQIAIALNENGIACKFRPIVLNEAALAEGGNPYHNYVRPAGIDTADGKETHRCWYDITIVWERGSSSSYRFASKKPNGKARIYIDGVDGGRKSIYRMDKDGNFRYNDMAIELKAKRELRTARDKASNQASFNSGVVEVLCEQVGISRYGSMLKATNSPTHPVQFTFSKVMSALEAEELIELLRASGYMEPKKEG